MPELDSFKEGDYVCASGRVYGIIVHISQRYSDGSDDAGYVNIQCWDKLFQTVDLQTLTRITKEEYDSAEVLNA